MDSCLQHLKVKLQDCRDTMIPLFQNRSNTENSEDRPIPIQSDTSAGFFFINVEFLYFSVLTWLSLFCVLNTFYYSVSQLVGQMCWVCSSKAGRKTVLSGSRIVYSHLFIYIYIYIYIYMCIYMGVYKYYMGGGLRFPCVYVGGAHEKKVGNHCSRGTNGEKESYRFRMTRRWVNDNNLQFLVNYTFKKVHLDGSSFCASNRNHSNMLLWHIIYYNSRKSNYCSTLLNVLEIQYFLSCWYHEYTCVVHFGFYLLF